MKALNLFFIVLNVGCGVGNFALYATDGSTLSLAVALVNSCVAAILIYQRLTYTTLR